MTDSKQEALEALIKANNGFESVPKCEQALFEVEHGYSKKIKIDVKHLPIILNSLRAALQEEVVEVDLNEHLKEYVTEHLKRLGFNASEIERQLSDDGSYGMQYGCDEALDKFVNFLNKKHAGKTIRIKE